MASFFEKLKLAILYICAKFCQSISKGFRVTDLTSGVNARVFANVDVRTDGKQDPYIIPCLRHA